MRAMTSRLFALLALFALGCSLEAPERSAGACGGAGQRCCPADERGDAGAGDNGCLADHICVANTSMDGGVTARTICQRCVAGQIACDNRCVDPASDNANCGGCGVACNAPNRCQAPMTSASDAGARVLGVCACATAGQIFCAANDAGAGACVNPLTDNANCGRCGNRCPGGVACMNGSCSCAAGQSLCPASAGGAGACTNLQTDNANCGRCGAACATGQSCVGGSCACGLAVQIFCAGAGCTNPNTDNANCGGCGVACPAGQSCVSGMCSCPLGQTSCASVGCVNLTSDSNNCGACGRSCSGAFANAVSLCVSATCVQTACLTGFGDCNAAAGCETSTATDVSNCGACNNRCRFANAAATCVAGVCTMGACNTGFRDCNGDAADGCETSTATDALNCGACGNRCTATTGRTAFCSGGTCMLGATCALPLADCDGMAGDGCEVNTSNNASNCGACGSRCDATNGTPTCAGGVCVSIACNSGFGNCDGNLNNGCEADFATNVAHCGGCGNRCVYANASASCALATCRIGACNTGFGDCNASRTDGCETNLNTSTTNCGSCGRVCSGATPVCSFGSCVAS